MPNKPVVFIYSSQEFEDPETPDIGLWECHDFEVHRFVSAAHCDREIALHNPHVIVTTGLMSEWGELYALPYFIRYRWLHWDDITAHSKYDIGNAIYACFVNSVLIPGDQVLISAFTCLYKTSNAKLERLYASLVNQTHRNWEWVLYDDSPGEMNHALKTVLRDPRVRYYTSKANTGMIGHNKRVAGLSCVGDVIAEIDHDDFVMPDTFRLLAKGFKEYPECGFYYTECIETHENGVPITYGEHAGFGYVRYYDVYVPEFKKVMPVMKPIPINGITMRHIVGVPNHIRAWRSDIYRELNGHNPMLHVADDYELIVRTFLRTRFLSIPTLGYIQYYDNERGTNAQDIRRAEIQRLVRYIAGHYEKKITDRVDDLKDEIGLAGVEYRDINLATTMIL